MSFGSGFSGGFGSNNQSTGFGSGGGGGGGGFGASSTGGAFGQQQSTGFGTTPAPATGGGLFGSGGTGFGSTTSGFNNASKPFGSTTSTTGGGLFNSGATTGTSTGFGGFGTAANNNNNNNTTAGTGFGASSTGSTLFGGANKTGFGTGTSTGGGLFGSTSSTGGGFGASSSGTTGLFGSSQSTALAANNAECQGTGATPFTAYTEKEQNSSTTNHYQSITFMQPYQKFSFEELRLADYNAGRKFGNGSGQAGAFGASTGFGGFGQTAAQPATTGFGSTATGGGIFGQPSTSAGTGFGSNTQTSGAFGSGGGGGLFGQQNKPAGGLFGSTATTTASTTGGLFGTAGGTGFGAQQNTTFGTGTGNSLFGNNNQNQQKPGALTFGQNTGTSTGAFGANTGTTSGGLFGNTQTQNQGSSLFGANTQQASGGLFGQQNQTQTAGTGFGAFGQNNQQKPGGLFGNTNNTTGSGLFGQTQNNQQQQQTGSNLFNQTNNAASGGLFGSKPAQSGSGLFGSTQQQPQQGNSLFGTQNPQPQGGGLNFGSSANASNPMGIQQNDLQGPPALFASSFDANPYGSASIFSGLPQPAQQSPGPVATPISAGQKQKKSAALPQFKINPSMASRFSTPQRRNYGFTYSSYGTPSSVSSASSTPGGLSSSLLSNSISRNLGKSFSTSNLRRTFDSDGESILSPGAFSANSSRYGTGSLKKLNIDRSLRTDLFGAHAVAALPAPERNEPSRSPSIKKKVSFDASTVGGTGATSSSNGVAAPHVTETSATQDHGFTQNRSVTMHKERKAHSGAASPTKESALNSELTTVHENGSPQASSSNALIVRDQTDPELGDYWTLPEIADLKKWSRDRLKSVSGFRVGRQSCGQVTFDQPVDLTVVDLNRICGTIVVIELRSLTVYPVNVNKPPVGQGLNVPSTITLENSWPRQRDKKTPSFEKSGPRFEKHVKRLAMVNDTKFVDYNADTGEWTFKVPHFTTYGLEYDDDADTIESNDAEVIESDRSFDVNATAQQTFAAESAAFPGSPQSFTSTNDDAGQEGSDPDDTFAFKKRSLPPGAFDETAMIDAMSEIDQFSQHEMSFLGERSAILRSDGDKNERDEPSELHQTVAEEINVPNYSRSTALPLAGTFPTHELASGSANENGFGPESPISRTPPKTLVDQHMGWMEQLQRTVSPRKQDRQMLRKSQNLFAREARQGMDPPPTFAQSLKEGDIVTSIDLMDSLFGQERVRRQTSDTMMQSGRSPQVKSSHTISATPNKATMVESDREFHTSFKPSWSAKQQLTYVCRDGNESTERDVSKMKFEKGKDITPARFERQRAQTKIHIEHGFPKAQADFPSFAGNQSSVVSALDAHENLIWRLLGILLDDQHTEPIPQIPEQSFAQFETRIHKDRLATFWSTICQDDALDAVAIAQNAEERAVAYLSANKIPEACATLSDSKNYRLATLIAQIGGDDTVRETMTAQLEEWRSLNVLSEISDPVRALYEMLAGNTSTSSGKSGQPEDVVKSFLIPERFGMDWKRAFGLKLWYGIKESDPLDEAIRLFATDLATTELRKPQSTFLTSNKSSLNWTDPIPESRRDVMWGLLELYANRFTSTGPVRDLAEVLMPENIFGLPLFHRLSFELYRALAPVFSRHASPSLGDTLTTSFAAELEAVDQWQWAIFALLHLSESRCRQESIQRILAQNAETLYNIDNATWSMLVDEFQIPKEWIWEALALFTSSRPDIGPEVSLQYLLKAQKTDDAHRLLIDTVAPLKLVEQDYAALGHLLTELEATQPRGWDRGGGLYMDFVKLMDAQTSKEEKRRLVAKLAQGLSSKMNDVNSRSLGDDFSSTQNFLKRVAVKEMSQCVAQMLLDDPAGTNEGKAFALQLPLNPEIKAMHAKDLSWAHYRQIMAAQV